ncbi:MAG TPA: hypothetical protein VMS11_06550 [Solirubrobacterales bacterium]|nr:hypothetical protein [Solirubrobacterales bacterium]
MSKDEKKPLRLKSGEILTDELAEQLADEAERGYDISELRRQYVGRPSLGRRGVSPRISFRASPDLLKSAQRRADDEGRALSDLAREALERYLDE